MGNTQSLPIDSYLDRHPCSGRNITWHYIHNNGSLPAPYSQCPYASEILSSHCCADGACTPSWFDREYGRYPYANWDGLRDPYNNITNTTIGDWHNGTSNNTAASGNNRVERPARGGMCLGMEPSLWYAGNHWPPLGLDGSPMESFRQMKWGDSSNRNEKQQQANESNSSAKSGRLEHRVVISGAAPMKTITISKLATYILTDLKAALWKMGTLMNTLGFFMGILVGYLICLETNGGLPQQVESQLSRFRALQTEATGPQTSTAKTNKKKKKRNKNVTTQQDDLQDSNELTPPASPPTPAPQNTDPEVSEVPIHPQAPRNGPSQDDDLQVSDVPVRPQTPQDVASQHDNHQVPDVPVPPQSPRDGASQSNDPQVSDVSIRPQAPRSESSQNDDLQVPDLPVPSQAPRDGASQSNDPQVSDVPLRSRHPRDVASQHDNPQVLNYPSIRPQAPWNGVSQNSNPQIHIGLTPPISPPIPAPQNYFSINNNFTPRNGASQSSDPRILNHLAPPISQPTTVHQNNSLAVGNSSTPPRYNVRERRRLYVDWGSLRRTDNAASQSPIGTRSQQGSQSVSQRVWQQGSRVASTDSDSEQVRAQHRNPSTRPPQRLS